MCQRKTVCDECKKNTDGLTICTYPDGNEIHLCPYCLEVDTNFCKCCGHFAAGTEGFDIIHPGYCNNCIEEMEEDYDDWDDEYEDSEYNYEQDCDEDFPNGSRDY